MKKNFNITEKRIIELNEQKDEHVKSMTAAALQSLLGVACFSVGVVASTLAKCFCGLPILAGSGYTCLAIALFLKEHKEYKRIKEKLKKQETKMGGKAK